jgi:thiosulfate/3-mercaptopyruvate sulfurtransferase
LEARGGHIPGAVHLDWLRLVDESGRLRSPPDLLHALASVGVFEPSREPREIIVYCTGGVRSAFAWAVLRALGYPAVRNYDGSFWEWAADRSLPVETAPGPR